MSAVSLWQSHGRSCSPAASFTVLASFGCSSESISLRQPNAARLLSEAAHVAKSKNALFLGSESASEESEITLRSSEPNLKYKTKVQEHEFGTVVAIRPQLHERPNPFIKRTCLRHAAYVQR
jgi:hypothetical protein